MNSFLELLGLGGWTGGTAIRGREAGVEGAGIEGFSQICNRITAHD